jgi:hypothetical protein
MSKCVHMQLYILLVISYIFIYIYHSFVTSRVTCAPMHHICIPHHIHGIVVHVLAHYWSGGCTVLIGCQITVIPTIEGQISDGFAPTVAVTWHICLGHTLLELTG